MGRLGRSTQMRFARVAGVGNRRIAVADQRLAALRICRRDIDEMFAKNAVDRADALADVSNGSFDQVEHRIAGATVGDVCAADRFIFSLCARRGAGNQFAINQRVVRYGLASAPHVLAERAAGKRRSRGGESRRRPRR